MRCVLPVASLTKLAYILVRDASPYMPTDVDITEEGNLKPPPPVQCLFGPIEDQVNVTMKMFQAQRMCESNNTIPCDDTTNIFL